MKQSIFLKSAGSSLKDFHSLLVHQMDDETGASEGSEETKH